MVRPGLVGHRTVTAEFSISKNQNPFGKLRDVLFVGNQHDGKALLIEVLENLHDLDGSSAVEIAGRFVGQQDGRAVYKSSGDGDSLLLSTGHLRGVVVHAVRETDLGEGIGRALLRFGSVQFRIESRQGRVFERRGTREQIETLKNKTNLLIPNVGESMLVVIRDINSLKEVLAGSWAVQATEQVHERRLSAARSTHDGNKFAAMNLEAHATESVNTSRAQVVVFVKIDHTEDRSVRG